MSHSIDVQKFGEWIVAQGGEVRAPTSEWEFLRYSVPEHGVLVIYVNAKGRMKISEKTQEHIKLFEAGKPLGIVKRPSKSTVKKTFREALAERDGLQCWFCRDNESALTLEHLLSVSHGGSNHLSNLVLACEPCNRHVGNKPIVGKIFWRELCQEHVGPVWEDQTHPDYVPWIEEVAA